MKQKINFNIDQLDIENNEEDFSLSKQQYKSKSLRQEYLENGNFVDLGLPSGTLWAKYNLGCDSNLLNSYPESTFPEDWYGNYYAWGEIEDKKTYGWGTYKYVKDSRFTITKYCSDPWYGYNEFTDDLTELLPEDDIAYQTMSRQRMPTKEQFDELLEYTNKKWITGKKGKRSNLYMNVEGLAGELFTSKINGNQIFIPAAGRASGSTLDLVGSYCNLWSSSLDADNPYFAWYSYFNSHHIGMHAYYRYDGRSIRPILNQK